MAAAVADARAEAASCSPRPAPAPARRSPTSCPRSSAASACSSPPAPRTSRNRSTRRTSRCCGGRSACRSPATCMKGRGNYLCLHRFERLRRIWRQRRGRLAAGIDRHARSGRSSIDRRHGSRAPRPATAPSSRTARGSARSGTTSPPSAENCLGNECPRYHDCYVTRMRQRAAESDVVIVNHHLLFADAAVRHSAYGEVIPDMPHAVARRSAPARRRRHAILRRRRQQLPRRGVARAMWTARASPGPSRPSADAVQSRTPTACADHARSFFDACRRASDAAAEERHRVTAESLAVSPTMRADARRRARRPRRDAAAAASVPTTRRPPTPARRSTNCSRSARARAASSKTTRASCCAPATRDYVYFLEVARARRVPARGADRRVAHRARRLLFDRMRATVLTSATLAVERLVRLRPRRGWASGKARRGACWRRSSTTRRQAMLYLPRRMPSPKSPAFADAVAREMIGDCSKRDRGPRVRAVHQLRDAARRAPALRRATLPLSDAGAGRRAPRSALLEQFRATPNAVLLRDLQLLAGRGRRRRSAQLRDHRQAAVRLARRSDHGRAHRGHQRPGRRCRSPNIRCRWRSSRCCRGSAADPPPHGSRRAGRARPAPADDGIWPAVSGVAAAGAGHARPRRHPAASSKRRRGVRAQRESRSLRRHGPDGTGRILLTTGLASSFSEPTARRSADAPRASPAPTLAVSGTRLTVAGT